MQQLSNNSTLGEITQKIHQLAKEYPVLKVAKNEVVLQEDSEVTQFYFLEKGMVRMSSTTESGKVVSLHLLSEGSFFPLLSVANHDLNHYELRAVSELQLRIIPAFVFKEWLMTDPEICYYFFVRVAGGLIKILGRLEGALTTSAIRQVAGILWYFVKSADSSDAQPIVEVTHQELADWVGLTRENVTVQMRKLATMGILNSRHGQLHILDKEKLRKLAQLESVSDLL